MKMCGGFDGKLLLTIKAKESNQTIKENTKSMDFPCYTTEAYSLCKNKGLQIRKSNL